MGDFAKPGDKVRFLDCNGYDIDLESAREHFTKGQVLVVADVRIGNWNSTYRFENGPRWFNTVMFEPVKDEAPVAESQPETEILVKASLTKDEVIDRAIATLKRKLTDTSFQGTSDEQMRAAMADVIAEVRVTALDGLLLDAEALDGARHLMQWLSFDRPTDKALMGHCKALRRQPPENCTDADHVSPTALRTYWILKAIVDEHRRLCAK